MIVVIVNTEIDPFSGKKTLIVSHGVDSETDLPVTLPPLHPEQIGAKFNAEIGEYVLDQNENVKG